MKKIVLVLIPLLSLICKAEGNRSVTLIIEVDSFICQETQISINYMVERILKPNYALCFQSEAHAKCL